MRANQDLAQAVSMAQALKNYRASNGADSEPNPLEAINNVIHAVNAVMSNPAKMVAHECSREIGRFWNVKGSGPLREEDLLFIQKVFVDAGWTSVQTVYYEGMWAVTLSDEKYRWSGQTTYNGDAISSLQRAA